MDKKTEALKLALEALQAYGAHAPNCDHLMLLTSLPPKRKPCSCGFVTTITAIRESLAQQQEPVAFMDIDENGTFSGLRYWSEPDNRHEVALYKSPSASKPWVDLTENNILNLMPDSISAEHDSALLSFAHAVIEAYKEKNA